MENKLKVGSIIKEGIGIGLKNAVAIIVNTILWIITIWIPYINIGTTIGMVVGIVTKASKGETISMTEIFNPKYRKQMGDFFLTTGLISMGITPALLLFIAPGFVLSIAWSQALLIAVDKEKNPTEAISLSNKVTYGNKGTMFFARLIVSIIACILALIFANISGGIGVILGIALVLFCAFVNVGIDAYVYKSLCSDL